MSASLNFPPLKTVGYHAHSISGVDAHNIPIDVYTPPRDQTGTQVAVIGWNKRGGAPSLDGSYRVVTDTALAIPPEMVVNPRDLFDLPDGQYEVIGQPHTAEGNPFDWNPGSIADLRKVDG